MCVVATADNKEEGEKALSDGPDALAGFLHLAVVHTKLGAIQKFRTGDKYFPALKSERKTHHTHDKCQPT